MLSIRESYEKYGVIQYYTTQANYYHNPHSVDIADALNLVINLVDWSKTFDLACGNGLITELLHKNGINVVNACDPFLAKQYTEKNGKSCQTWSFAEICKYGFDQKYSTIVASYCLHLAKELPDLLYQIAITTKQLVVISPSKHPSINDEIFQLIFIQKCGKTWIRLYQSLI